MPVLSDGEQLTAAIRLAIAALVGLAIGLEREWSGHASGPNARFAGIRTFFLLGILGGTAGLLLARGLEIAGAVVIGGALLFAAVAYGVSVFRPSADLDATTEVAAMVAAALGVISGLGWVMLAAGTGSVVVLALYEKGRLHDAVHQVGETERRAALRFSVLALVVLPLLPPSWVVAGYELNPRALWLVVLFLSGMNFAAYIARRGVRADRGYAMTGLLGGLVSSTVVTLDFSRRSRLEPELGAPLATGVVGACTVLVPRVLIVAAVLNGAVALALVPFLAPVLLVGLAGIAVLWRMAPATTVHDDRVPENPLRLWYAIKMAVAFQAAMILIDLATRRFATAGLFTTAAFLGVSDVDALTVSMTRLPDGVLPVVAARAITVGVIANTLAKMSIALGLGGGRYRLITAGALLVMAIVAVATAWLV